MQVLSGTTTVADGDWSGELTTEPRIQELVAARDGVRPAAAAWTNLTHGTGHYVVGPDDHGLLGRGDALVTDRPGVALAIRTADCAAVFLTGQRSIALGHAGMAGTVQGILPQLVSVLTTHFDEQVADLSVSLGPHICARCYTVSDGNRFFLRGFPAAAEFIRTAEGTETFDLAAMLADQAERIGIPNVDTTAPCTHHDSNHYSARHGQAERQLSYLMIADA